jgi:hypothetical protein
MAQSPSGTLVVKKTIKYDLWGYIPREDVLSLAVENRVPVPSTSPQRRKASYLPLLLSRQRVWFSQCIFVTSVECGLLVKTCKQGNYQPISVCMMLIILNLNPLIIIAKYKSYTN